MHIPDGLLSAPVWLSAAAVSAAGIGLSTRKVGRSTGSPESAEAALRQAPLMGVTGAFLFAAQMVNFPVAAGTSGHLAGGLLAALLLGPWAGALIMTTMLVVQALLFQDGGITALGANVLNMALAGSMGGYLLFRLLRILLPGRRGAVAGAFLAAWAAVVISAALAAVEIALSGIVPLRSVLGAMAGVHALIGLGEGLITAATLGFLLRVRPELLYPACRPVPRQPTEAPA
jgi:cobalt/nickel transport system permease protein